MTLEDKMLWEKVTTLAEDNLQARELFEKLKTNTMKSLRGRRVLLTMPELKKSAVELSAKDEEAIMQEAMKKWLKLEVFAVGDEVTDVKLGDRDYVQTYALESGEKIEIDGSIKLMINDNAIAIVW
jgi:hypothetical protein